jgi:hypothetical protein
VPGDDAADPGDGATITDTLVTPSGNTDIPIGLDFFNPFALDSTDAFGNGFNTNSSGFFGGSSGGGAGDVGGGGHAFTFGDYTFDPGADGLSDIWDSGLPTASAAPLLELGLGSIGPNPLAGDELEVFSDSGTDLGSISASEYVGNLFGITTAGYSGSMLGRPPPRRSSSRDASATRRPCSALSGWISRSSLSAHSASSW